MHLLRVSLLHSMCLEDGPWRWRKSFHFIVYSASCSIVRAIKQIHALLWNHICGKKIFYWIFFINVYMCFNRLQLQRQDPGPERWDAHRQPGAEEFGYLTASFPYRECRTSLPGPGQAAAREGLSPPPPWMIVLKVSAWEWCIYVGDRNSPSVLAKTSVFKCSSRREILCPERDCNSSTCVTMQAVRTHTSRATDAVRAEWWSWQGILQNYNGVRTGTVVIFYNGDRQWRKGD